MRHLTRGLHAFGSHHHAYNHYSSMYHHAPMHHVSIVGGIGSMIAHAVISFAVWHALGPIFRHAGIGGALVGSVVLVALTFFIWRALRRVVA